MTERLPTPGVDDVNAQNAHILLVLKLEFRRHLLPPGNTDLSSTSYACNHLSERIDTRSSPTSAPWEDTHIITRTQVR